MVPRVLSVLLLLLLAVLTVGRRYPALPHLLPRVAFFFLFLVTKASDGEKKVEVMLSAVSRVSPRTPLQEGRFPPSALHVRRPTPCNIKRK